MRVTDKAASSYKSFLEKVQSALGIKAKGRLLPTAEILEGSVGNYLNKVMEGGRTPLSRLAVEGWG